MAGSRFAPVLRDPQGLELMCLPRHLDRVSRFLKHALDAEGVSVVWSSQAKGTATFQLYAFCGSDRHHHLRLVVNTRRQWQGVTYFEANEVFRNRDTSRSPQRPAAVIGTLAQFLPGYLGSGHIERESTTRLAMTADTHPAQLRAVLGKMVGTTAAERFVDALRDAELSSLIKEAPRFRRALLRRSLLRHPLKTLSALARRLSGGERDDPGFLVAVMGPQGAETEALAAEMRTELPRTVRRQQLHVPTAGRGPRAAGGSPQDRSAARGSSWWRAIASLPGVPAHVPRVRGACPPQRRRRGGRWLGRRLGHRARTLRPHGRRRARPLDGGQSSAARRHPGLLSDVDGAHAAPAGAVSAGGPGAHRSLRGLRRRPADGLRGPLRGRRRARSGPRHGRDARWHGGADARRGAPEPLSRGVSPPGKRPDGARPSSSSTGGTPSFGAGPAPVASFDLRDRQGAEAVREAWARLGPGERIVIRTPERRGGALPAGPPRSSSSRPSDLGRELRGVRGRGTGEPSPCSPRTRAVPSGGASTCCPSDLPGGRALSALLLRLASPFKLGPPLRAPGGGSVWTRLGGALPVRDLPVLPVGRPRWRCSGRPRRPPSSLLTVRALDRRGCTPGRRCRSASSAASAGVGPARARGGAGGPPGGRAGASVPLASVVASGEREGLPLARGARATASDRRRPRERGLRGGQHAGSPPGPAWGGRGTRERSPRSDCEALRRRPAAAGLALAGPGPGVARRPLGAREGAGAAPAAGAATSPRGLPMGTSPPETASDRRRARLAPVELGPVRPPARRCSTTSVPLPHHQLPGPGAGRPLARRPQRSRRPLTRVWDQPAPDASRGRVACDRGGRERALGRRRSQLHLGGHGALVDGSSGRAAEPASPPMRMTGARPGPLRSLRQELVAALPRGPRRRAARPLGQGRRAPRGPPEPAPFGRLMHGSP